MRQINVKEKKDVRNHRVGTDGWIVLSSMSVSWLPSLQKDHLKEMLKTSTLALEKDSLDTQMRVKP